MCLSLQRCLLGAYQEHGIASTRKVIAAFRHDPVICRVLEAMSEDTTVPGEEQSSPLVSSEQARAVPPVFKASPCVEKAASITLKTRQESEIVSIEDFFLALAHHSCGPTAVSWRRDGYAGERISALLRQVKEKAMYEEKKSFETSETVESGMYAMFLHQRKENVGQVKADEGGYVWEPKESTAKAREQQLNTEEEDTTCKICMDNQVDCVLINCGHVGFCLSCAEQLESCPLCREKIERVVRTFRA